MRRWIIGTAVGVMALGIGAGSGAGSSDARKGGIFRISLAIGSGIDSLDPALEYTAPGWQLLDTTCARLMTYPDKPVPEAFRLVPEVATGFPKRSRDLKTYTFTLRKGFRFSDGKPVRANAFARAINRALAPDASSPWASQLRDVVGADEVLAGRSTTATGVVARGNTLTVRFTQPVTDFATRTAMPFMCAVPPTLPPDREGLTVIPSAGPYRVVGYRPNERVTIRRNPFYRGTRPNHLDGFNVDLSAPSPVEMVQRVDRGEADWGHTIAPQFFLPPLNLTAKYGLNKERFFVRPGLTLRLLALNSSRPLFRDNPALRQAVNFALDRWALGQGPGLPGIRTDQFLPHTMPGFKDQGIYPLTGSDTDRAKALAAGNLRGGKAVFYAPDFAIPLAQAQLIKSQLEAIGLEIEIKPVPFHIATAQYTGRLAAPGEPWDLAIVLWSPPIPDPFAYLNTLLEARFIGGTNVANFASQQLDAALRGVARMPQGRRRERAYGDLDVQVARDLAPLAPYGVLNEVTFVSQRVDPACIVLRPALDLTAVCLK